MVELGTAFHRLLAQMAIVAYFESGHRDVSASGSNAVPDSAPGFISAKLKKRQHVLSFFLYNSQLFSPSLL
jgi:hypothetical protein